MCWDEMLPYLSLGDFSQVSLLTVSLFGGALKMLVYFGMDRVVCGEGLDPCLCQQ